MCSIKILGWNDPSRPQDSDIIEKEHSNQTPNSSETITTANKQPDLSPAASSDVIISSKGKASSKHPAKSSKFVKEDFVQSVVSSRDDLAERPVETESNHCEMGVQVGDSLLETPPKLPNPTGLNCREISCQVGDSLDDSQPSPHLDVDQAIQKRNLASSQDGQKLDYSSSPDRLTVHCDTNILEMKYILMCEITVFGR